MKWKMTKILKKILVAPPPLLPAIYKPAELPEHAGNPLIEALPPFRQHHELLDIFGRFPHIAKEERRLPAHLRMMAVSRIDNYLEPLPAHGKVIDNIGLITRSGYINRNPLNREWRRTLKRFYREAMEGKLRILGDPSAPNAPSFALFGVSGVGKTTVVERSLSFLPQVLHHENHNFTQVTWMKLNCPLDGSLKQLLLQMLREFDWLLGTNYTGEIGDKSIDELIASVAVVAANHHLGLFVIDEIQHLLASSGIGQTKMLNFFVDFFNMVRIPLLTVGTPRALSLLSGTFREARRVGGHGSIIWNSLNYDDEWSFFLEGLWKYQWTANFAPLTKNISKLMYENTQGIHALVVRLFQLSQLETISKGDDCIMSTLIEKVAQDQFKLLAPMLDALRKGDKTAINKYEDLLVKGLAELGDAIEMNTELAIIKQKAREKNQESAHFLQTVSALTVLGLEQAKAQKLAEIYFNSNPGDSSNAAVISILEKLATVNVPNDLTQKSLTQLVKSSDSNSRPVDNLIEAGYITPTKK